MDLYRKLQSQFFLPKVYYDKKIKLILKKGNSNPLSVDP